MKLKSTMKTEQTLIFECKESIAAEKEIFFFGFVLSLGNSREI